MRRLTISTKLLTAMLPLMVVIALLLALMVRNDLRTVDQAGNGAKLGVIWGPLIDAIDGIETEQITTAQQSGDGIDEARAETDEAIGRIDQHADELESTRAISDHLAASRSALSDARRAIDASGQPASGPTVGGTDVDPILAYERAAREIIAIGQVLPAEAGDSDLGRELLAVGTLAEARLSANRVAVGVLAWELEPSDHAPLLQAQAAFADLDGHLSEFAATAPETWTDRYQQSGFTTAIADFRQQLTDAVDATGAGRAATFDVEGFSVLIAEGVEFQHEISASIIEQSGADVDTTRRATMIRLAAVLATVVIAAALAVWITRSITRRVRQVASGANHVADRQLPALVEALSDDSGDAALPEIEPLPARGSDELAELAHSFNKVQTALNEVAREQVEVLRRGVSDLFVTMARRNRSLIDRQLAMLDEYEAEVDDPETLANYYQLDHLATRMRRNSESLLVLANAEPTRRRVRATEIDDVVRASISEVEDYKRIQIERLEALQVRGNVVADVSHLLAELFDNATSFSPPGSPVRVGGRRVGNAYVLRIVDDGVGVSEERLAELNELLQKPPVLGLTASTTLGMSVVSLLADKHGIAVTLSPGEPGLTVDVILPSNLFDAAAEGFAAGSPFADTDGDAGGATPADSADAYAMTMASSGPNYDILKPAEPEPAPEPAPAPEPVGGGTPPTGGLDPFDDDGPRVVASDLASLSSSLTAFQSGMQSATAPARPATSPVPEPAAAPEPEPAAAPEPPLTVSFGEPAPSFTPSEPAGSPAPTDSAGEFSVPPAPPMGPAGPSARPVAPDAARPAPRVDIRPDAPGLPTRSPGSQADTGGPDRIADGLTATTDPGSLSAALAAFDTSVPEIPADLPSRDFGNAPMGPVEDPTSVAPSRLDPAAFRERLRSFQSEFTTGRDIPEPEPDYRDLGGDHR